MAALPAVAAAAPSEDVVARLAPMAFSSLPLAVRRRVEAIGCTIPQSYFTKGKSNVVSGRFTQSHAREWAVLCSRDGSSEVAVFTAAGSRVGRLGHAPDAAFVQEVQPGVPGFSRQLSVGRSRATGRNTIHDAFAEKASTVWFWNGASWRSALGG